MKKVLFLAVAGLLAASVAFAGESGYRHEKEKKNTVAVHIAFLPREVRIIREYYGPRYRNLPPGLQKKYRRTGQLPPGWRKKIEPFPVAVERQLQVLPPGYERGVIDGHAVIYNPRTEVIFDIAVLY